MRKKGKISFQTKKNVYNTLEFNIANLLFLKRANHEKITCYYYVIINFSRISPN